MRPIEEREARPHRTIQAIGIEHCARFVSQFTRWAEPFAQPPWRPPPPDNTGRWLNAKRADFTVGPAPYAAPRAGEILVRVHAVAINPVDRMIPAMGEFIMPWLKYPFIAGSDVAGVVAELGEGVTRFVVGDRMLGFGAGGDEGHRSAEGAFQHYAILPAHMARHMPEGLSTAATGLFEADCLALGRPSAKPQPKGQTLIVWGGSTNVGSNVIQLAVAAGYDVIATASPHNVAYMTRLGARQAFDDNSATAVPDIVAALRGRVLAGALAIGHGTAQACIAILGACQGNRFVAMATPPAGFDQVPAGQGRLQRLVPALARMIWESVLPSALAEGRYVAAPEAMVVGHGLAEIPRALDLQLAGVSARKPVVAL